MGTIEKWIAETDAISNMINKTDFTNLKQVERLVRKVEKLVAEVNAYSETPRVIHKLHDKQIPR